MRDYTQLLSSFFIRFMLRHFLGKLGKSLKKQQCPFQRNDNRLIVIALCILQVSMCQGMLRLIDDRAKPSVQYHVMIRYNVTVPGHGNTAAMKNSLLLCKTDILAEVCIDLILMGML